MKDSDSKENIIDIDKGNNSCELPIENKWDIMSKSMRELIEIFFLDKEKFLAEKPLVKLKEYVDKYDRLLYTVLSDRIYEGFSETEEKEDLILRNIDLLLELCTKYIEESPSSRNNRELRKRERIRKIVLKMKDHINLAIRQYRSLKQTDEEYIQKFNEQIGNFKEKVTKEITSQLITLVGIFTAIAFILFGGINSFNGIFLSIKETSILDLIIISSLWIVGMSDIVFIFLLGISKMTNLDIGNKANENILDKYIWIFWFNAIFITVFLSFIWLKFCLSLKVISYEIDLMNKKFILIVGTLFLLIIFCCLFSELIKRTNKK